MWETECDVYTKYCLQVKTGSNRFHEHEVDREREIRPVRVILHKKNCCDLLDICDRPVGF